MEEVESTDQSSRSPWLLGFGLREMLGTLGALVPKQLLPGKSLGT